MVRLTEAVDMNLQNWRAVTKGVDVTKVGGRGAVPVNLSRHYWHDDRVSVILIVRFYLLLFCLPFILSKLSI